MIKEVLLQKFNEDTSGKNHLKGKVVLKNDLVSYLNITSEDGLVCIDSKVISSNLFSNYHTTIELDTNSKNILSTYCSCPDFEKNEFKKTNYCCKHLVATFYQSLDELAELPSLKKQHTLNETIFKNDNNSILNLLLPNENEKEELKIHVYITKKEWTNKIAAEFKIGIKSKASNKMYVIKDILQFLTSYNSNIPIKYSGAFIFSKKDYRFSTKDKKLINFMNTLRELDLPNKSVYRKDDKFLNGKSMTIPDYLLKDFFEIIKGHMVYLGDGFFYRSVLAEIQKSSPPVVFGLSLVKSEYILKSPNGMPKALNSSGDVLLYGTTIYLPDYDFCYEIAPYLQVFSESKSIVINKSEEERVLRELIPKLYLLSQETMLSKNIKDQVVMENVKFNFYFDKENRDISLLVKVKYGLYEFNIFSDCTEKIIYRDLKKEQEVLGLLKSLGFEEIQGKFYFLYGDDFIFNFFKSEINRLQRIGDVYYSQNFKGLKSLKPQSIKGNIKKGKYNYFEMDFKISDISKEETSNILKAFRDNLKYYKLKNGEYLDLEDLELKKFLKLLDLVSVSDIEDNTVEISKNRALFISNYLEENKIKFIKGKKELNEVKKKLKTVEKIEFKVPEGLNAELREYQKVGFNWLKTLDYLGFGGILADEMGLGKTLQAIAFLLDNKESKSLIVTPTSLIYNWYSEFSKFAPDLKVAVVSGDKDLRQGIIENLNEYDVIITTYNLIKRDFDLYKNLEFDYCILDEAQYIKNSGSQNAILVKEIKAKTKFALSGTPIENSLLELWSIFDFVMPGYLYDEKRFNVRYQKRLKEEPEVITELNKLINPFILRRKKKDVIKELPEKIEKKFIVSLEGEQKNAYATFAKYASDIINKKVKDDEFKKSKIEILSYITKLRQLCLDPSILLNDYTGDSSKIEALIELLNSSIKANHKILVFSQFTSVLKKIASRLKEENISFSYLDGSVTSDKRMGMVKEFNDGSNSVFLISLKAGGTGLNLTSADIVIHFDPWWNPAVEEQATDRAHRIGQKNVVEVIKMIAKGTIEEKIISLQHEKKDLISKVMDNENYNDNLINSLDEEDILSLFDVDII